MTPYFSTPERVDALVAAARAWEGTPFAPGGSARGTAASCIGLAAGVLAQAGWVLGEELPRVSAGWGRHHTLERMRPWLRARPGRFAVVTETEDAAAAAGALPMIQPGDLIVVNLDLIPHHVAVALPGWRALQTVPRLGAHVVTYTDPALARLLRGVYRPLE